MGYQNMCKVGYRIMVRKQVFLVCQSIKIHTCHNLYTQAHKKNRTEKTDSERICEKSDKVPPDGKIRRTQEQDPLQTRVPMVTSGLAYNRREKEGVRQRKEK